METKNSVTRERVTAELETIGFANAADFLCLQEGQVVLRDLRELAAGAAVASMEVTPKGVKVKFYDKLKALELLGKQLGMFAGGGVEPEGSNLLEALLAVTEKEVDTGAISELQPAAAAGDQLVEPAAAEAV